MRIVGVDPGVTTGLCLFVNGAFIKGREARGYLDVETFIGSADPKVVVIEDFRINRSRPAEYHAPIRMIGVVEYLCGQRGISMVLQSPSILRLSLPHVEGIHRSRHVRSACAHVFYFLKRKK
jgi:hypothetical protein